MQVAKTAMKKLAKLQKKDLASLGRDQLAHHVAKVHALVKEIKGTKHYLDETSFDKDMEDLNAHEPFRKRLDVISRGLQVFQQIQSNVINGERLYRDIQEDMEKNESIWFDQLFVVSKAQGNPQHCLIFQNE